jgi:hypothetical protein
MAGHDTQPAGVPEPPDTASHDTWVTYAVSRGMDLEQARGLTRDQLRMALIPVGAPRSDVPYIERLDRDPESRAVRHAASRPAWER